MQEKQTKDNTKHINIKIPIEMYDEIEKLYKESERTQSQQIRFMLAEYLRIKKG